MKNHLIKVSAFIGLLIIPVLMFIGSCSTSKEEKKCGDQIIWYSTPFSANQYYSANLDGNMRVFRFEDLSSPEDICTKEHIKCEWKISLKKPLPDSFWFITNGIVYWMGLWEESVELEASGSSGLYLSGFRDVGLDQAFGDEAGWIGMRVDVKFYTQGDLATDVQLFNEYFNVVEMVVSYYQYKN